MFYKGAEFSIALEELGDTWQLEGIVIGDGKRQLCMFLPDAPSSQFINHYWTPTIEELEAWLKQSDDPVTKIADKSNPLGYAVVRKGTRQLDQAVAWACYKRDNYTCVYCGASGVPLTYDHFLAQLFGGQTTLENGRTCCRPCNKRKGHMTVDEWTEYAEQKGLNNGAKIPA